VDDRQFGSNPEAEVRWGSEERRECRRSILSGKADIAFEHLLDELRLLAGSPKRCAMHDPIAKWSTVSAFTARDRPRNADELGAHFIRAEPNRRIAVATQVNKLEVWGKFWVRNGMGALQVKALRVLKARPNAVLQQHVEGPIGFASARAIGKE
jgi:hypothetical protein